MFVPVTVLAPGMKFINEGLLTVKHFSSDSKKDIKPKVEVENEQNGA